MSLSIEATGKAIAVKSEGEDHAESPLPTVDSLCFLTTKNLFQVISTFIVFFNTWGLLLTFGAFQAYYEQVLLANRSSSDIAWISTTCAFIILSLGAITGPLFDLGYYRLMAVSGSILQSFGLMMLSLSTSYYQCFLAQGICVGIGAGMLFTPGVAAASGQFRDPRIRAKVMGMVACGSSAGGVVYPLIYRSLVSQIGFPWTVRTIAFIIFVLYCISFLSFFNNMERAANVRELYDISAFTDLPWMCILFASTLSALAYYVPFLYLPLLIKVQVADASPDFSFDIISITNGVSIIGRIVAGFIAAKFGPTETTATALVCGSVVLLCWVPVHYIQDAITWASFWGLFSGMSVALGGAIVPLFCPTLKVIGTRVGMYWVAIGLGMLLSGPIAGAILDANSATFNVWRLNVFDGCLMLSSALCIVYPIICLHHRRRD